MLLRLSAQVASIEIGQMKMHTSERIFGRPVSEIFYKSCGTCNIH